MTVHNCSDVPAYLRQARYLAGVFVKTEVKKYAFSYVQVTDGNFPLTIPPKDIASFPLWAGDADKVASAASLWSRLLALVLKRDYVWIELRTISGKTISVGAHDVTSWQTRPLWLTGRWTKELRPVVQQPLGKRFENIFSDPRPPAKR